MVGGLYGVSLGCGYFGESMFFHEPDASKVAFATLVRQLKAWGVTLVDCQMPTDHLARFGAREVSRVRFMADLEICLSVGTRRGPWRLDAELA